MDDCFLNLIYIMKKNILLLSFLCNFSLLLSAQTNVEKGLQSINRSSAEATINFLASDELQGREAGFHGSRVTSEYIASLLQWMGVSPLADSYFQPFDAYRKESLLVNNPGIHLFHDCHSVIIKSIELCHLETLGRRKI